jgi:hypothetical protein
MPEEPGASEVSSCRFRMGRSRLILTNRASKTTPYADSKPLGYGTDCLSSISRESLD